MAGDWPGRRAADNVSEAALDLVEQVTMGGPQHEPGLGAQLHRLREAALDYGEARHTSRSAGRDAARTLRDHARKLLDLMAPHQWNSGTRDLMVRLDLFLDDYQHVSGYRGGPMGPDERAAEAPPEGIAVMLTQIELRIMLAHVTQTQLAERFIDPPLHSTEEADVWRSLERKLAAALSQAR